MNHKLYTIGHSASPLYTFLAALKKWEVTSLIDVRSTPHSRRFPHFNQTALAEALRGMGVRYVFLGKELGGRPDDSRAYTPDGLVDYAKRRSSRSFRDGLKQIRHELAGSDSVLMCAEEDPLNCHRFLMICPALIDMRIEPLHMRKTGVIDTQHETEDRLLRAQKLGATAADSLFASDRAAALKQAYSAQAKEHAFRKKP